MKKTAFVRGSWRFSVLSLALVLITSGGYPQTPQTPLHLSSYAAGLPASSESPRPAVQTLNQIPLWNFNVTASAALGGQTFPGTMVGRSPYLHGKTSTAINVQIIPIKITIGSTVFDPTAPASCINNLTPLTVVQHSPIFTNNDYVMNGVDVGATQYIDAFQRASFWPQVQGTPYHLLFNLTTLATQSLTVNAPSGAVLDTSKLGGCGNVGLVDINQYDPLINAGTGPGTLITGLGGQVNPGTLPVFLTESIAFTFGPPDTSKFSNICCVAYHRSFPSGANTQIYLPVSYDTSGLTSLVQSSDVELLSQFLGATIGDPLLTLVGSTPVGNATPVWGDIGIVIPPKGQTPSLANGGCLNLLESGAPLGPANSFQIAGSGLTYHLHELAFFGWFFGTDAGAGGKYSNNGTLAGAAKPCPPGGTN